MRNGRSRAQVVSPGDRRATDFCGTHEVRCRGSMPRVKPSSWSLVVAAGAVLGSVAGVACKGDATQDAKTLRIGVITSLTGPQAAFGAAHKNGYTIAANEINAKGSLLGKQVEVVYYDDQGK